MKHLTTYLEDTFATPANTMGMGNPGQISPDTLTEPIGKAFSEVEKDKKKKKKRKVKDLSESLFDQDLAKKGAHIGDVYELDEWTIPARGNDYAFVDDIINYGITQACGVCLGKSKWQKILKPISSFPPVTNNRCMGSYFLKYVTELILCCESVKQIPEVVRNYIMECRNNPDKFKKQADREFIEEHTPKDVQVQTLDMPAMDMDLRMVVIKFIMEDGDDNLICVTFKKRGSIQEGVFDDNKELTFRELTGCDIERRNREDWDALKNWLIKNTNIKTCREWWSVAKSFDGGLGIYKDIYDVSLKGKMKLYIPSEQILKISYNKRDEAIVFSARSRDGELIPSNFHTEWNLINDIIKAFGATPSKIIKGRWTLDMKP